MVRSAVVAPRRSRYALVAAVVPWAIRSTWSRNESRPSRARGLDQVRLEPLQQRGRRGGCLVARHPAGLVDHHRVGECPPNVDPDDVGCISRQGPRSSRRVYQMSNPGYDAVIIGAGHNALVTGVYLSRAGWRVLVLERAERPGGAVYSAEVTRPGFVSDLFATNLNLFLGSPVHAELGSELERLGLRYAASAKPFANVYPDGRALRVTQDPAATLAELERHDPEDALDGVSSMPCTSASAQRCSRCMARGLTPAT